MLLHICLSRNFQGNLHVPAEILGSAEISAALFSRKCRKSAVSSKKHHFTPPGASNAPPKVIKIDFGASVQRPFLQNVLSPTFGKYFSSDFRFQMLSQFSAVFWRVEISRNFQKEVSADVSAVAHGTWPKSVKSTMTKRATTSGKSCV